MKKLIKILKYFYFFLKKASIVFWVTLIGTIRTAQVGNFLMIFGLVGKA